MVLSSQCPPGEVNGPAMSEPICKRCGDKTSGTEGQANFPSRASAFLLHWDLCDACFAELAAEIALGRTEAHVLHPDGVSVLPMGLDAHADARCSCAEIMRHDSRRHFKGCPLREDLAAEPV